MSSYHPDVVSAARSYEYERYIAATLVAGPRRAALIAIAAFAGELRRIPDTVKEPMMGEIRLQWWRDVIEKFGTGGKIGHPLADALADAHQMYSLPKLQLVAMTEAPAFDLYPDPMPDEASLDGYLSKTEAIPFALAMQIMRDGSSGDMVATDLAGRAFGLARLLVLLPYHLSRGHIHIPISRLREHGISEEQLLSGAAGPDIHRLLDDLVATCRKGYVAFEARLPIMTPVERMAFLPLAVVPTLLAHVTANGRDPLRSPIELAPLSRVWRIARARWLGL